MGQIIPWPPRDGGSAGPRREPARREPPEMGGPRGEIVLFLGVRYERHDEPGGAPGGLAAQRPGPAQPGTGRRRRRG